MEQRIFHGNLKPADLARALVGEFNRGNMLARQIGDGREVVVQIGTHERSRSGGATGLTITLRGVEDGVAVQMGAQSWMGIAASLGQTIFYALRSPWHLLGRLDDVAQDIESLQLAERAWGILDQAAQSLGATLELSERLRRLTCEYCLVANPVGEPACMACGAPLGRSQPRACPKCGFAIRPGESICPNCRQKM